MRKEAGMVSRQGHRRAAGLVAAVAILSFIAAACAAKGEPGAGETGATVTGPAATAPAETGPSSEPSTDSVWLPSKGAEPSTPADGTLALQDGGIHPWWSVHVYGDGRVIWLEQFGWPGGWLERRLTPEGVELVRSGTVPLESPPGGWQVPASAWEDPEAKPYVPSRYVVCSTWSRETMHLLPQQTQDLLRGNTNKQAVVDGEVWFSAGGRGAACPAVTIEEARALDRVFVEVGFERSETDAGLMYDIPDVSSIAVIPLLPDGTFEECCPG